MLFSWSKICLTPSRLRFRFTRGQFRTWSLNNLLQRVFLVSFVRPNSTLIITIPFLVTRENGGICGGESDGGGGVGESWERATGWNSHGKFLARVERGKSLLMGLWMVHWERRPLFLFVGDLAWRKVNVQTKHLMVKTNHVQVPHDKQHLHVIHSPHHHELGKCRPLCFTTLLLHPVK